MSSLHVPHILHRQRQESRKGLGEKGRDKKKNPGTESLSQPINFSSADKPSDENMCQCENMIMFQNQVTEKLKSLVQNNILLSSLHSY